MSSGIKITTPTIIIGAIILIGVFYWLLRLWQKRQNSYPMLPVGGVPQHNYGSNPSGQHYQLPVNESSILHVVVPPGPISPQNQQLLDSILTPTELNENVNDMSIRYIDKIIEKTPESLIIPLQLLDDKYKEEQCMICLEELKIKKRPVVRLSCNEHYFHYSCYETLLEDEAKKKRIEYMFGQNRKLEDMDVVNCPFCRKQVCLAGVYIHFEGVKEKHPSVSSVNISNSNTDSDDTSDIKMSLKESEKLTEESPLIVRENDI